MRDDQNDVDRALWALAVRLEADDPRLARRLRRGPMGRLRRIRNRAAVVTLVAATTAVAGLVWSATAIACGGLAVAVVFGLLAGGVALLIALPGPGPQPLLRPAPASSAAVTRRPGRGR